MVTCACGLQMFVASTVASFRCPRCRSQLTHTPSAVIPQQPQLQLEPSKTPQQHWELLHSYAFSSEWNTHAASEWYQAWTFRIPNLGCDCRQHWRDLVSATPPDFSSADAFFRWTVAAHNAVNLRLDKPTMPIDAAIALYRPKFPATFF